MLPLDPELDVPVVRCKEPVEASDAPVPDVMEIAPPIELSLPPLRK